MTAQIWTRAFWLTETRPSRLRPAFASMLIDAGFEIVNFAEHRFRPFGYSACWIIAESHCAVHTFPEERKTFVEIASCNRAKFDAFNRLMRRRSDHA